jgi:hypothetical protein
MLNSQTNVLNDAVWAAVAKLDTMNTAKIVDHIIEEAAPGTVAAARHEGFFPMLRSGVMAHVRKILGTKIDEDGAPSLFDIHPDLAPYASALKRGAYYVESLDEFVSLAALIENVRLLDDARKYMRRKGEETLAEANALDKLYYAAETINDNIHDDLQVAA